MYKGLRNYYNQTSKLCEPVTLCASNQEYDYLNNLCKDYQYNLNFPSFNSSLTSVNQTEKISVVIIF